MPTNQPLTVHAGDLDGAGTLAARGRWDASVTITVHNASHNPVPGATVTGDWSNGANGSGSGVTDIFGQCMIIKRNLKSNVGSATFTVSDVSFSGYNYEASHNHDLDGGSNGTVIIVSKP